MKARGEVLVNDQNPTFAGQLRTPEEEAGAGQESDEDDLLSDDDIVGVRRARARGRAGAADGRDATGITSWRMVLQGGTG